MASILLEQRVALDAARAPPVVVIITAAAAVTAVERRLVVARVGAVQHPVERVDLRDDVVVELVQDAALVRLELVERDAPRAPEAEVVERLVVELVDVLALLAQPPAAEDLDEDRVVQVGEVRAAQRPLRERLRVEQAA